jgi:hypothetical protein
MSLKVHGGDSLGLGMGLALISSMIPDYLLSPFEKMGMAMATAALSSVAAYAVKRMLHSLWPERPGP